MKSGESLGMWIFTIYLLLFFSTKEFLVAFDYVGEELTFHTRYHLPAAFTALSRKFSRQRGCNRGQIFLTVPFHYSLNNMNREMFERTSVSQVAVVWFIPSQRNVLASVRIATPCQLARRWHQLSFQTDELHSVHSCRPKHRLFRRRRGKKNFKHFRQ